MAFSPVDPKMREEQKSFFAAPNASLSLTNMAVMMDTLSRQMEQLSQQQQMAHQTFPLAERVNPKPVKYIQKSFALVNPNPMDFLTDWYGTGLGGPLLTEKMLQEKIERHFREVQENLNRRKNGLSMIVPSWCSTTSAIEYDAYLRMILKVFSEEAIKGLKPADTEINSLVSSIWKSIKGTEITQEDETTVMLKRMIEGYRIVEQTFQQNQTSSLPK